MIQLEVSCKQSHKHFLDFLLSLPTEGAQVIYLQLPAWRPGRYELQNYARYIQRMEVFSQTGQKLPLERLGRNRWKVEVGNADRILVRYNFYACQLDAGGCFLDHDLCYINWSNCVFYVEGRIYQPYQISLDLPEDYQISFPLTALGRNQFQAIDFYQLIDAPLVASPNLQHRTYKVENSSAVFHVWFYGNCLPNWQRLIADFQKFTREHIALFGQFPELEFHFQFLIAPWKFYHGVEHRRSTVLVLGPDAEFEEEDFYHELLEIASHELFHCWNGTRIRPVELTPYDLTRECLFPTGFVIEGITTFYGSYLLYCSGVWSLQRWIEEINAQLKRYANNFGRKYMSLVEASLDLWTDGYTAGIPHRKISIYNEGALAALLLHLWLLEVTQGKYSLHHLMQLLWKRFGNGLQGYSLQDYKQLVAELAGYSMNQYFEDYIEGTEELSQAIGKLAHWIGCKLEIVPAKHAWERRFGFTLTQSAHYLQVVHICPDSPADRAIAPGDKILSINDLVTQDLAEVAWLMDHAAQIKLVVNRNERLHQITLQADGKDYFSYPRLELLNSQMSIQTASGA
ncbi:MAG: PDZ domain-containing protein [Cytophagales bacterium]|nr:PDZ domain-containing protein [Bernardetiaceae bacterium]MDW8211764.1 PDZ domain-containing protein [Cytophagales bacterium]